MCKILTEAESIYEQLKKSGENIPLVVRQIIGLTPADENDSDNSDDESFVNTTYPVSSPSRTLDDNDSIIDDIEKVTFTSETGEIGFEAFERAISSNYY